MFGLFKKKKVIKYRYEKQLLNIGVTKVRYIFTDNSQLVINVYGYYRKESTYCAGPGLVKSVEVVKDRLIQDPMYYANDNLSSVRNYIDDPKNPTISVYAILSSRTVLSTEDYFEEFDVKIEDK